jgi:hypothetical protein
VSGSHAFGAAAVTMGTTAIQNTPTLRGCNQDPAHPVTACDRVRASWLLDTNPNYLGNFPCASAGALTSYNSYVVNSIVTARDLETRTVSRVAEGLSTSWGVIANGTIYGIKDGSDIYQDFEARKDAMTVTERKSFIIINAEVVSEGATFY